jgi:hypothetical protein
VLSDENLQRYTRALYPIAFLLILVPLADLSIRGFPPQLGSLQWRFGIVGVLFSNLGTVLLGLGLVGLVAAFNSHRGILKALGYVALTLAAVTIAMLALFALDAVQMRTLQNTTGKRVVLMSSMGAVFAGVFGVIALISIGRGALAASRPTGPLGRRARPAASPLVVAGQGATDA